MIIASGFVEIEGLTNVERVVEDLRKRGFEINEIERVKVMFLVERPTISAVRSEIDDMKNIESVANVHLTWYSLEGGDDGAGPGTLNPMPEKE